MLVNPFVLGTQPIYAPIFHRKSIGGTSSFVDALPSDFAAFILRNPTEFDTAVSDWVMSGTVTVNVGQAATVASERAALVALYQGTGGAAWRLPKDSRNGNAWTVTSASSDPCRDKWYGVICTPDGYVDMLGSLDLVAPSLPDALTSLTAPSYLDLSDGRIGGAIPTLPAAWRHSLVGLELQRNYMESTIQPGVLDVLEALVFLDLSFNSFAWPLENLLLPALGKLQRLTLKSNPFGGFLRYNPAYASLMSLSVASTNLTGSIPPDFLALMTNVDTLDLSDNALEGTIPASILYSASLRKLEASTNAFMHLALPPVGEMSQIVELYLADNQFTALPVPAAFPDLFQELRFPSVARTSTHVRRSRRSQNSAILLPETV